MTSCAHRFEDAQGNRVYLNCQSCGERDPLEPTDVLAQARRILGHYAESRGLKLLEAAPQDPVNRLRLAMPYWRMDIHVDFDDCHTESKFDLLLKRIDDARRSLFARARHHLTEHDRSPQDRLDQIEVAARALLDAMGAPWGANGPVAKAWNDLDQLVRSKTGAISWQLEPKP